MPEERIARKSLGTSKSSSSDPNTVVLKTKGKVATNPSGSGAGRKAPLAQPANPKSAGVQKQKGRTVVPK